MLVGGQFGVDCADPTNRDVRANSDDQVNIGDGKDSETRQRKSIEGYEKRVGIGVADWFYDAGVSGADPVESGPGFAAKRSDSFRVGGVACHSTGRPAPASEVLLVLQLQLFEFPLCVSFLIVGA